MTEAQFRGLHPLELARIRPGDLPTPRLLHATQTLGTHRQFERAEACIEELSTRKDLPEGVAVQDIRTEVLRVAVGARDLQWVERILASTERPDDVPEDLMIAIAMLRGSPDVLDRIEAMADRALRESSDEALGRLGGMLLYCSSALGVIVARGTIDPATPRDVEQTLELVEEARDMLLLPPQDPAWEIFDLLSERHLEGGRVPGIFVPPVVIGGTKIPGTSLLPKAGRYILAASSDGLQSLARSVKVKAGDDRTGLDFRLVPGEVVSGRILDEEGNPLPEAQVFVSRESSGEAAHPDGPRDSFDMESAEDGTFLVDGVPPGLYQVLVSAEGKASACVAHVKPGTTDLEIEVPDGEPIAGWVRCPDGTNAAFVSVVVENDERTVFGTATDAEGRFVTEPIAA